MASYHCDIVSYNMGRFSHLCETNESPTRSNYKNQVQTQQHWMTERSGKMLVASHIH